MSIEEIKDLEHLLVEETEYYIYLTPEECWHLEIDDTPENEVYYSTVEMLKQECYPNMQVLSDLPVDPSVNIID